MYLFVLGFFHRYVILTGQSNLSIKFRVRLITSGDAGSELWSTVFMAAILLLKMHFVWHEVMLFIKSRAKN